MKRIVTKYPGIYERKSDSRTYNGKPDVCYDISYKVDSRKIWEKVGFLSEGYSAKLASQVRAERMRSLRHGQELPKQKKRAPLFKDIAKKYLAWAKDNKTRQGKEDESRYNRYLGLHFDNNRLNEITSFDLERLKMELSKKGLAGQTVKHCLVLVRQMFNKAILWGLYQGQNPIKGVKMPTLNNRRERFLSHEEADALLTELISVSKQTHDICLIALHCGLRAGEIFNLRGQDMDFENGLINISDPKNKASRKAFMTEAVKAMLQARIPEKPEDLIFKDKRHGDKIGKISRSFCRTVEKLGLNKGVSDSRQKVCFHSLRHTFASWLCLQGETILTVKELLGHKSLAMTERYSHLIPDHKRRATLALEQAFNGKRNGATVVSLDKQ